MSLFVALMSSVTGIELSNLDDKEKVAVFNVELWHTYDNKHIFEAKGPGIYFGGLVVFQW